MRLAARKDRCHKAIVDGLRERGVTVAEVYQLGRLGIDFFAYSRKAEYWIAVEVKSPDTPVTEIQKAIQLRSKVYMTDSLEAVLLLLGETP